MHKHTLASGSLQYSLPSTPGKHSLDARLDRVFQMAENVDARCSYMMDAATQKRRLAIAAR